MQIYFPNLLAIQQQTLQLENEHCIHCKQTRQLVSHGFIRKKRVGADPAAVGKRVFCSNRNLRTGCGRTVQLYLDSTVRYLQYAGQHVAAFVLALIQGVTIQRAYLEATGAGCPRNAYRWLNKLEARLSVYRSRLHQPPLSPPPQIATSRRGPRRSVLISTFDTLSRQQGQRLCASFQLKWQQSFLP